ncbi:SDR family oxidoreductase [Sphingomonas sp. HF-S4]|uniref:SDR family oxidoreductase n=1 Tax=Sphingomonas agrestis TaxID=3080540 RepID=A0ABU3YAY1_9SPHN|nr:SDR family oxidoreductase [Sphingomonas sp. HF-S4]MDV3458287.1 SDR family oxidoreductase [Sphingomonas sp. HF-S4]
MKSWFITGASSGLGLSMTRKLLGRGDLVHATARRPDAMRDLVQRHGDRLEIIELELTDTLSLRQQVDRAFASRRIDVVVSNAGYGLLGAAEELSDAQIDRQIATNLTASIQLIRAALPHLRTQGGGRILQVSSEGGQVAYPNFSLYHATKWGIEGFVEAVAQEVAPFGIEFTLIEPGPTGTGFGAALDRAAEDPIYHGTPAGDVRRAIAEGNFVIKGDVERTADAMIAAGDAVKPARRVALGSAAYDNIERELLRRLEELKAQRDVAYAADQA